MGNAVAAVALALAASLQPTALIRSVAFLDCPPPGRTLAWRFALGLTATLLTVAVVAGGATLTIIRGSTVPTTEIDSSDLLLGGVALVAAVISLVVVAGQRRRAAFPPELPSRSLTGPLAGFGLGVRTMATHVAALALYIAAVGEIVSIEELWGFAATLLVVVTATTLGAGLTAPTLDALFPDRAAQLLPRMHAWAISSGPVTSGVLIALTGAALVVRGVLD